MGWEMERLVGWVVCLLAAPQVQFFTDAGNGWPHDALRYHQLVPINRHFRDCKALLVTSLMHVSSARASTGHLPLLLPLFGCGQSITEDPGDLQDARSSDYVLCSSSSSSSSGGSSCSSSSN